MMRKEYIAPKTHVVKLHYRMSILAASAIPYSEDGDADAKGSSFLNEEDNAEEFSW